MEDGLSLKANDFALFGLPERFALDRAQLDARWKQLQGAAHPDRFATDTAAAQRVAMQWAVRINEAYRRLKDPLARAAYVIPALVFSLGISIACLLYLSDGPAHVEISELFLPCILGGIPGAFLWWFVTKLFERKRP